MYNYSKDGITVASMLDTRKPKANGEYPIKIRVNYRRIRCYYSIGKSMTRKEWDNLFSSKSAANRVIRESLENSFSLVKSNVEALAERGSFSFDILNARLGRATGDIVNNTFRAKISLLEKEERIGSMQVNQQTLIMLEKFAGDNIAFNSITVQWLRKCESHWLKTKIMGSSSL